MRALDVVVPVHGRADLLAVCLRSVLEASGPALADVLVVDDRSPGGEVRALVERLRREDSRVHLLSTPRNVGFVGAANLGLCASRRDVVLLNSDTEVTPGWLEALAHLLDSVPGLAAASPLSNNATLCSVPRYGEATPAEALRGLDWARVLRELPPFTPMPTVNGFCMALARRALDEVGVLDSAFGRGYHEENDWCQRARAAGLVVGRANRAFVFHVGQASFGQERAQREARNARRLAARYPDYLAQTRAFDASPQARLAAEVVAAELRRRGDPRSGGRSDAGASQPAGV